jgi:hypothetical protein
MGSSAYSYDTYARRVEESRTSGHDYFRHTEDIAQGRSTKAVHEKLNPAGLNRAGQNIRESRDSDAHPVSNAVAVVFDVTGSMHNVPRLFVRRLGRLMRLLTARGYLADPQVLFGAVGDAYSDAVPLQVGQFESGNEMDEALSLMFLEGGGGGGNCESYELALYYLARHAAVDCFEKRGKKGYLFLMGDELPYNRVDAQKVRNLIGDDLAQDIPISQLLEEVRQKFEVFWIFPGGTAHWHDPAVVDPLREMFGQNLLEMENPSDVCEFVASVIGVTEGHTVEDVTGALEEVAVEGGGESGTEEKTPAQIQAEREEIRASARRAATIVGEYRHRRFDLSA